MIEWIRTCQECGYLQEDKKPEYGTEPSDAYCNRKCKKCKSEALNYGSEKELVKEDGKFVIKHYEETE